MANLDPVILRKLNALGTRNEEFIYDGDIIEMIRFGMDHLMESHMNTKNCVKVKDVYNALRQALVKAQRHRFPVKSIPPEMKCPGSDKPGQINFNK